MKRTFEMNGTQYNSMMEIARELGVKRVYPRDFDKYGIVETTGQNTQETDTESTSDVQVTVDTSDSTSTETKVEAKTKTPVEDKVEDKADTSAEEVKEEKKQPKKQEKKENKKPVEKAEKKTGTPEQIKEVQKAVDSMTLDSFSNSIHHFTTDALLQMVQEVGGKEWETITNEPIRRMRLMMELKEHYFPGEKKATKPASVWKKLSLDELVKVAKSNKVEFKDNDNDRIKRMNLVMALNKAGIKPEEKGDSKGCLKCI